MTERQVIQQRRNILKGLGASVALAFTNSTSTSASEQRNIPVSERVIRSGDAELFTQALGNPDHPPVLLIMGAMASMLWWPDAFCEGLVKANRYVIRYDNRDTGLSTSYTLGKPGYTLTDMASDAIAILDGLGLASAHVVGMSLGGIIAQRAALTHSDRVRTLTLISTSPIGVENLQPMNEEYATHSATGEGVDWSSKSSILDFVARDAAMIASKKHPHDAHAARQFIQRDIDRATDFAAATNHFMLFEGDATFTRTASELTIPLLVIHGTSDPIFPIAHGEAFVKSVKSAKLLRIEGGGHELHAADIPTMTATILAHTEGR